MLIASFFLCVWDTILIGDNALSYEIIKMVHPILIKEIIEVVLIASVVVSVALDLKHKSSRRCYRFYYSDEHVY